jgi:ribonuclease Z
MAKVTILGSGYAVPDENHENTHMVLHGENCAILIDCAGSPISRLRKVGVHFEKLTDVILTHFHPDHTYGFPILLMGMWLLGRTTPLRVHGLHHCMERAEDQMGFYHWDEWPNFFPVAFHRLPEREEVLVLDDEEFRITASPGKHFIPTIGVRIEVKANDFVMAYSSDTEPCRAIANLAHNADLLIHESTGGRFGHTSAIQAGTVASEAGAKRLGLIHYRLVDADDMIEDAETTFGGPIFLAEDFMEIELK